MIHQDLSDPFVSTELSESLLGWTLEGQCRQWHFVDRVWDKKCSMAHYITWRRHVTERYCSQHRATLFEPVEAFDVQKKSTDIDSAKKYDAKNKKEENMKSKGKASDCRLVTAILHNNGSLPLTRPISKLLSSPM